MVPLLYVVRVNIRFFKPRSTLYHCDCRVAINFDLEGRAKKASADDVYTHKSCGWRSAANATPSPTHQHQMEPEQNFAPPVVMGTEDMMSKKAHGSSAVPIQKDLRWSCDVKTADNICNHNRHYAEHSGYWETTSFLKDESAASGEISFHDSNTGKQLFVGPRGRAWNQFVQESKSHGWPSFRDSEVNWEYVRVLGNGECISVDGTHVRHRRPKWRPGALVCCCSDGLRFALVWRSSGTICRTATATATASILSRWRAGRSESVQRQARPLECPHTTVLVQCDRECS